MQSGALVSSMDGLPRSQSEHANMLISGSGNRPIRRSSIGPSPGPSPYRQMMMGSPQHESYLPTLHGEWTTLLVTLCGAARHCLVHRCPGSTSDPLWGS